MKIQFNSTSNKKFGYFFSVIFFLISFYFFNFKNLNIFYFTIFLGTSFFTISLFRDYWLKELNNSWFKLGILMSRVISPLIIGIIFYFLITPFGIVKRIINIRKKNNVNSTWRNYSKIKSDFKNPF